MSSIYTLPPFLPNSAGHTTAQQNNSAVDSSDHDVPQKTASEEIKKSKERQDEQHPLDKVAQMMESRISNLMGMNIRLTLEHDEDAGVFIYKAVNRVTGEVIRQYPTEEMLKMLSSYQRAEGLSLNSRA